MTEVAIYARNAIQHIATSPSLGKGDIASLRRMDVDAGYPAVYWKIKTQLVPDVSDDIITRMRLAEGFKVAAILRDLHGESPLGIVLAETGYSEMRLSRLLRVRGQILFNEVQAAARFLKSKGRKVRVDQLADLILVPSEKLKQDIASSYYLKVTQ